MAQSCECQICCNETKRFVKCLYCSYISCFNCNERYILESVNKPHCISCKKEFSSSFFHDNFTKSFITKKYKIHREQILFEKEKYLLPATQPEVEKIYKKKELNEELCDLRKIIADLKLRESEIKHEILNLDYPNPNENKKDEEKKDIYISQCPNNDCRGFLSTRYKCGICNLQACSECREVKKENHICDPNTIETIKEIKKTSRNCPNCKTLIFKISGCDQMFCTQCHIAFCWKTGKIEKGMIHNPHYFEYMKNANGDVPRNPFEERCGGFPTEDFIHCKEFNLQFEQPLDRFGRKYDKLIDLLIEIYRQTIHIHHVEIARLPTIMDNLTNQDLRIKFLMKEITNEDFKIKLQRREKDKEKKKEYRDVLETYVHVMQDLFNELRRNKDYSLFLIEEQKIREYIDKGVYLINNKYSSKLRNISTMF
jgi:hypothetical protein